MLLIVLMMKELKMIIREVDRKFFLFFFCFERILRLIYFIFCCRHFASDFEAMLARKKEEKGPRRKRRDIDLINDNDDIIDQLLQNMKQAAEVINSFFYCVNQI